MNIVNAIKRPFTDLKKAVIGIIFYALPILNILSLGYFLEVLKTKKEMPAWTNFANLFINGVFTIIIEIIYFIPILILLIISLFVIGTNNLASAVTEAGTINVDQLGSLLLGIWPLLLITFLVLIFIAYILPSALVNYARNYKFKESLQFKQVIKNAFKKKYFLALLWGGIVNIVLILIVQLIIYALSLTGIVLLVSIINTILSAIVGFTTYVIVFTLLGETLEEKNGKKRR